MQGFRPTKPAYLDPLQSEPVRTNFQALASNHAGATSPSNPETGWMWLDTSNAANYRLRMYLFGTWVTILNNLMGGFPAQGGATVAVHTQAIPALVWTIAHNLNTEDVIVTFWDGTNEMIIPDTVEVVNPDTLRATFLVAQEGRACVTG